MTTLVQVTTEPRRDDSVTLDIESIDVYLTFRCGLRCSHCFMGENLSSNRDMDVDSTFRLFHAAHAWNTKQVTFLGGEPTMHPAFSQVLAAAEAEGYSTRIVTNGQISYSRFLNRGTNNRPFVCFSVDGATADVHDEIRGRGTFNILLSNIERSRALGYRLGGIFSVSRQNVHEVQQLLELGDAFGFEYINVHYVTNRGYASPDIVLPPDQWEKAYRTMCATVAGLRTTEIRIERTFYDLGPGSFKCAVKEKRNLMVLPDGRVFMCMMFIDSPEAHSFVWTGRELVPNTAISSEQGKVWNGTQPGCCGMLHVNPDVEAAALKAGKIVHCMYDKERLRPGRAGCN